MTAIGESALSAPGKLQLVPAQRAFWGVMAAFLVHGLVVSTWVSRLPAIKASLRLGDGVLGLSLLGTAIGSLVSIPVAGSLVARYGSRRTVQWTGLGFCAAMLLPAFAQGAFTLFLALLAYGAFAGANDVAMNAQAVGTERLLGTPSISRFHGMFSLGGILGAAAGGWIASRGVPPTVHLTTAALAFAIIALCIPRLTVETGNATTTAVRPRIGRIPAALLALSAIGFCIFLSEGAMADWTAVYMRQVLHAGEGLAPFGYAVFSAAMAVFRFSGDAITGRIGRVAVIRFGGSIAAAGIAFAALAHSPYWALAGFAAAGVGFSSIIPLVFAAGGSVPSVGEGQGVATVSGLGYLGFLAGPPAIGFISEWLSLRGGLFLLVALSAAAALMAGAVERVRTASPR